MATPPSTSPRNVATSNESSPDVDAREGGQNGQRAGSARANGKGRLPPSLLLSAAQFSRMMSRDHKWLGSGSLGAMYEVEHAGARTSLLTDLLTA